MEKRELLLISSSGEEKAYQIAANEFVAYYQKITGYAPKIGQKDDGKSDLILIGTAAVNAVVAEYVVEGILPKLPIRSGTDEFAVRSCCIGERKALLIQGGLGRSTLYAVYAYFESLGCGWYWDGDAVPVLSRQSVEEKQVDILERPRFQYRGLRYFAHRGCKRFQAEMWDWEDWKQEIDYLVKRRVNMFMLRIGQDDLFQRAFPDAVSYSTEGEYVQSDNVTDLCGGYKDRRLFWSLEYRGKLRKKVLEYAFERGFIHPEDFGTMTHWYSLTPQDFLENKKPTCLNDDAGYDKRGAVWDIREEKNFEYYMQLTKTHICEFGKAEVFHTIGFAERMYSNDRQKNLAMKSYVYERYIQRLKEEYPTCPIFIASWDLWFRYTPSEVQTLLASLDCESCLIFDYTSDSLYDNNFTSWNLVGNFPYVFGVFHGYASYNDCLGAYPVTEERLKIAKSDSYCKGMILWPELSHSDTLMQEFFVKNAWADEVVSVENALEELCKGRYQNYRLEMSEAWRSALPAIELMHWSPAKTYRGWNSEYNYLEIVPRFLSRLLDQKPLEAFVDGVDVFERAVESVAGAKRCFEQLALLPKEAYQNDFIRRDVADLARTLLGRYIHFSLAAQAGALASYRERGAGKENVYVYGEQVQALMGYLQKILSSHEDFSLAHTLREIGKTEKIPCGFEDTLKHNTINWYCRSNVYETVKEIFIPEMSEVQAIVAECAESGEYRKEEQLKRYAEKAKDVVRVYLEKPFGVIDNEQKYDLRETVLECAEYFKTLRLD